MEEIFGETSMHVTKSLALSQGKNGAMICTKGKAIGSIYVLENDTKNYVGRDSKVCSCAVKDSKVSRVHMEITYIGALNQYLIKDVSTNGTYVNDGIRLKKNQEYYFSPMTELKLADGENTYKLK